MTWSIPRSAAVVALISVFTAGVVVAQLGDAQTASGSVSAATSSSADLYICEPGTTPGPACGPDDSGADEIVFEATEDLRPGQSVAGDVRLRNVGSADWVVTSAQFAVIELYDPGPDCPAGVLVPGDSPNGLSSTAGVFLLGGINDNPLARPGLHSFIGDDEQNASPTNYRTILVAAGGYEDVRLRLLFRGDIGGVQNCDGNRWNVTWTFSVS